MAHQLKHLRFFLFELDFQSIKFCVDTTPTKIGNYFPNYKIPVISEESLRDTDYDMLIVNAWNYKEEILAKSKKFLRKELSFYFLFLKLKYMRYRHV